MAGFAARMARAAATPFLQPLLPVPAALMAVLVSEDPPDQSQNSHHCVWRPADRTSCSWATKSIETSTSESKSFGASFSLPPQRAHETGGKPLKGKRRLVDVEQSHFDRMGISSRCGRFRPEPSPTRPDLTVATHRNAHIQGARLDLVALLGVRMDVQWGPEKPAQAH